MQDQLRLDGPPRQVAIVTGGGRGLGREMALSLSMAGAEVCLASRTVSQLDATADFIAEKSGRRPLTIPTDVQSAEQCTSMVDQTIEHFGKLDILVNNAGIGDSRGAGSGIWDMADEDWHDTIEVNLYSTFYCSRRASAYFRERGEGGVILNVSSGTALRATPGFAYAAAKAGVISLTKSMASSLAKDSVRVNCIVPGYISQAPAESQDEIEIRKARGRFNTARRIGEAWELGPLAVYLCADASSYVNGQAIAIDGGGLAGGIAPASHDPVTAGGSND